MYDILAWLETRLKFRKLQAEEQMECQNVGRFIQGVDEKPLLFLNIQKKTVRLFKYPVNIGHSSWVF